MSESEQEIEYKIIPEQFQKTQWGDPIIKQADNSSAAVIDEAPKYLPIPIAETIVPKAKIIGKKTVTPLDFGEFKRNQWGKPIKSGGIA